MFLIYLLLYTVVTVPLLACLLSWHYTSDVAKWWAQPRSEIIALLIDVWFFALAIGFTGLCLAYAGNVGLDYWDFTEGRTPVTEAFVRHLVFAINSLVFVLPIIGVGGWLCWWRWRFLRVHFGLGRGDRFLHDV